MQKDKTPTQPSPRDYTCTDCGTQHTAGLRGPVPTRCPVCRYRFQIETTKRARAQARATQPLPSITATCALPGCTNTFAKVRNQRYCSQECSQAAAAFKRTAIVCANPDCTNFVAHGTQFCSTTCWDAVYANNMPTCAWAGCHTAVALQKNFANLRHPLRFCGTVHQNMDYNKRHGLPIDRPGPKEVTIAPKKKVSKFAAPLAKAAATRGYDYARSYAWRSIAMAQDWDRCTLYVGRNLPQELHKSGWESFNEYVENQYDLTLLQGRSVAKVHDEANDWSGCVSSRGVCRVVHPYWQWFRAQILNADRAAARTGIYRTAPVATVEEANALADWYEGWFLHNVPNG